jgi:hypothetical protein
MKKLKTIHSSRTIMFAELEKVMAFSFDNDNFEESLVQNVTGKKSSSGIEKTANYLKQLYVLDVHYAPFSALKYFWSISEHSEKALLALIYAINHDYILAESIEVLKNTKLSEKATIESFEEVIEKYHPNHYSTNTRRSMAQNVASSWKQAGFIEGKTKNIRMEPQISFRVAGFAFALAYLKGERGEFIWNSIGVNALCLSESKLRELAKECSKKDLMLYQNAGSVTSISFVNLFDKIGINGN